MPEPVTPPATPAPTAPEPTPPAAPVTPQAPPDDKMIPKHRFDEQNDKLKEANAKLAQFEADKKAQEEKLLTEQGKFKELAEAKEKEAQTLREQLTTTKIDTDIREAARKLGAADPAVILKLVERSEIKLDDLGNVIGAEAAVTKLLEASPYLKGDGKTTPIGSPSNPGTPQTAKRFKASQLRDVQFYRDNEADILKAGQMGLIEDDLA